MACVRVMYVFLVAALVLIPAAQAEDAIAQKQGLTSAIVNPAAAMSLDQLASTRERPLFVPDRRSPAPAPVVAHAAPPPPPPAPPPQVSVAGIIVDAAGPRAVIRSDGSGKTKAVRLGDEIGGWQVTEIDGRRVVISLDERSVSVKLFGGDHGGQQVAAVHQSDRVFEVNDAGVLRSHRVPHGHQ
jgi:hypothetical protein